MAEKFTIEDARIIWPNFTGKEGTYNAAGDRNFTLALNPQDAQQMADHGWNVKFREPRDEGDEALATLAVTVKFGGRPPVIYMITERGRTLISEDMASLLDSVEIKTADVMVNPYEWNINGKSGITAYLDKAFITIREDALDRKYADVPMAGEAPLDG